MSCNAQNDGKHAQAAHNHEADCRRRNGVSRGLAWRTASLAAAWSVIVVALFVVITALASAWPVFLLVLLILIAARPPAWSVSFVVVIFILIASRVSARSFFPLLVIVLTAALSPSRGLLLLVVFIIIVAGTSSWPILLLGAGFLFVALGRPGSRLSVIVLVLGPAARGNRFSLPGRLPFVVGRRRGRERFLARWTADSLAQKLVRHLELLVTGRALNLDRH
jgi:hypothetical protein